MSNKLRKSVEAIDVSKVTGLYKHVIASWTMPKKTIEKLEVRGQGDISCKISCYCSRKNRKLSCKNSWCLNQSRIPIFAEWHKTICKPRSQIEVGLIVLKRDDESPTIEPSKSVQHEEWILRNNLGSRSEISTPLKKGVCGRSLPESMFVLQGNFFLWRQRSQCHQSHG